MKVTKILIIWFLVASVTFIIGILLGTFTNEILETALLRGQSKPITQALFVFAQLLLWPIYLVKWFWEALSSNEFPFWNNDIAVIMIHYIGYGVAFFCYWVFASRKNIGNNNETAT